MDITKRLAIKSNMIFMGEKIAFGSECALMDEASIEIQTLRTKVAELEHCVENRAKQWAEQHIKIADQAATIAQLEEQLKDRDGDLTFEYNERIKQEGIALRASYKYVEYCDITEEKITYETAVHGLIEVANKKESQITELQASNNHLREVLGNVLSWVVYQPVACHGMKCRESVCESCCGEEAAEIASKQAGEAVTIARKTLSATPAESLQAHDDEVIEKCAKVFDDMQNNGFLKIIYGSVSDKIRSLKEVK